MGGTFFFKIFAIKCVHLPERQRGKVRSHILGGDGHAVISSSVSSWDFGHTCRCEFYTARSRAQTVVGQMAV